MVKKSDKWSREKVGSGNIIQEPEEDLTKSTEPYSCTGHFQNDFTELCRRNQMTVIPPVVARPHRPASPQLPSVAEEKIKPSRGGKKEDKNQLSQEIEMEASQMNENKDPIELPPKTYLTKGEFEYFIPSVQVEMEYPDKQDSVTEIFIRGWKIDRTMMETLKQCCLALNKLHTINLWRAGLEDSTLEFFGSFLQDLPTLKTLVLDNNPGVCEKWHVLLKEDSPVQHLSLRFNNISDLGADGIGKSLGSLTQQNQKLLTLNLTGNKITDKGAEYLANGLRMNRCLLILNLADNQIGDVGGMKLAEVISKFPLTHEEVVFRRRLISSSTDRKSNSATGIRRTESHDRPGSVRSQTISQAGSKAKIAKSKKPDSKNSKEEEKTKGKTKDAEKSKKGSTTDQSKSSVKKGDKSKGKKSQQQTEQSEASDASENLSPLLDAVEHVENGVLLLKGNMTLINLNLSSNKLTADGVDAFLKAMYYQINMSQASSHMKTPSGLLRLSLERNCFEKENEKLKQLQTLMTVRDPVLKSFECGEVQQK